MRDCCWMRSENLIPMTETIIDIEKRPPELSLAEFIWLHRVHFTGTVPSDIPVDTDQLEKLGYMKRTDTGEPLLRPLAISLFETPKSDLDGFFLELILRYPFKVGTGTKVRVLHAVDPEAHSNRKLKQLYGRILGVRPAERHAEIMALLDKELTFRRDNLQYLQALETWLNQRSWEKWKDVTDTDDGEGRITAVL